MRQIRSDKVCNKTEFGDGLGLESLNSAERPRPRDLGPEKERFSLSERKGKGARFGEFSYGSFERCDFVSLTTADSYKFIDARIAVYTLRICSIYMSEVYEHLISMTSSNIRTILTPEVRSNTEGEMASSNQLNKTAAITAPIPMATNEPPRLEVPPVKVAGVLVPTNPLLPLAALETLLVLVFVIATPLTVVV